MGEFAKEEIRKIAGMSSYKTILTSYKFNAAVSSNRNGLIEIRNQPEELKTSGSQTFFSLSFSATARSTMSSTYTVCRVTGSCWSF